MATRRLGRRRMGGCETHLRRPTHPLATQPTTTGPRLFLAPDHRPPLAGLKLVRPRPRPDGRSRCGRSSLTHGRTATRNTAPARKSHQYSPRQPGGHSKSPGQSLTLSRQKVPPWAAILLPNLRGANRPSPRSYPAGICAAQHIGRMCSRSPHEMAPPSLILCECAFGPGQHGRRWPTGLLG
jgi:hypothetical protein